MCFPGYEVRNSVVLYQNGAFYQEKVWIAGWHPELHKEGICKFIIGSKGDRETELIHEGIRPSQTFTVAAAEKAA